MLRCFVASFCLLTFLFACKNGENLGPIDTPESGKIYISVDESFRPVMEEQIKMFEALFPNADIIADYKSEADCFRDFFNDTLNRLVIVTRGLVREEERFMQRKIQFNPGWNAIASDAIAIIVHASSTDTLFTMDRLRQQLSGAINRHQTVVFDGLNATSTVRFITDSILKKKSFDSSVVRAAKNSTEVINYVGEHPDAVGFVGISWIGNPEDTAQLNLLRKVKIAYVQCDSCYGDTYVKPTQQSILTKRYPLVRGLYYANKENYTGLGTGFINFLKHEKGQLIFKRAYLGPVMGFAIRNVKINEELPLK